jgi:hypothetical protein
LGGLHKRRVIEDYDAAGDSPSGESQSSRHRDREVAELLAEDHRRDEGGDERFTDIDEWERDGEGA